MHYFKNFWKAYNRAVKLFVVSEKPGVSLISRIRMSVQFEQNMDYPKTSLLSYWV